MSSRRFTFPASTLGALVTRRKKMRSRTRTNPDKDSENPERHGSDGSNNSDGGSETSLSTSHLQVIYKDKDGEVHSLPVSESLNAIFSQGNRQTAVSVSAHRTRYKPRLDMFAKFLEAHTCYDLIPLSTKLVVLDINLPVKKAFFALSFNEIRAAPVWDDVSHEFVGMLSISDFITILAEFGKNTSVLEELLENATIAVWRERMRHHRRRFLSIQPDSRALAVLLRHQIHRLPVIDPLTGNVLFVLTYRRILKFLMMFMNQWMHFSTSTDLLYLSAPPDDFVPPLVFSFSLRDLKGSLGTYEKLRTLSTNSTIAEAIRMFSKYRVSSMPVLDADGKVAAVYAKFEAINLAANKMYNKLDVKIQAAIDQRTEYSEEVYTCSLDESFGGALNTVVKSGARRLLILDNQRVVGIVSLSDIFKFLLGNHKWQKSPRTFSPKGANFLDDEDLEENGTNTHL